MKQGIFSFFFLGTVCTEPEVTTMPSGTQRISVNCVANGSQKRGEQWEERPTFVRFAWWGDAIPTIQKLCARGANIGVQGKVQTYKNKEGKDVYDFQPDGFPSVAHWGEDASQGGARRSDTDRPPRPQQRQQSAPPPPPPPPARARKPQVVFVAELPFEGEEPGADGDVLVDPDNLPF